MASSFSNRCISFEGVGEGLYSAEVLVNLVDLFTPLFSIRGVRELLRSYGDIGGTRSASFLVLRSPSPGGCAQRNTEQPPLLLQPGALHDRHEARI